MTSFGRKHQVSRTSQLFLGVPQLQRPSLWSSPSSPSPTSIAWRGETLIGNPISVAHPRPLPQPQEMQRSSSCPGREAPVAVPDLEGDPGNCLNGGGGGGAEKVSGQPPALLGSPQAWRASQPVSLNRPGSLQRKAWARVALLRDGPWARQSPAPRQDPPPLTRPLALGRRSFGSSVGREAGKVWSGGSGQARGGGRALDPNPGPRLPSAQPAPSSSGRLFRGFLPRGDWWFRAADTRGPAGLKRRLPGAPRRLAGSRAFFQSRFLLKRRETGRVQEPPDSRRAFARAETPPLRSEGGLSLRGPSGSRPAFKVLCCINRWRQGRKRRPPTEPETNR